MKCCCRVLMLLYACHAIEIGLCLHIYYGFFSFVLVFACKLFNAPLDFTLCMSRCAKKGSMMKKEEEVGIFFSYQC